MITLSRRVELARRAVALAGARGGFASLGVNTRAFLPENSWLAHHAETVPGIFVMRVSKARAKSPRPLYEIRKPVFGSDLQFAGL
jgi:hypothetical protein